MIKHLKQAVGLLMEKGRAPYLSKNMHRNQASPFVHEGQLPGQPSHIYGSYTYHITHNI